MKRTMIAVTAAILMSAGANAAERPGASGMSPGHQMQTAPPSSTKGASEYSPGDRMQDKGTVGRAHGASGYSPGDQMNDRRKK